jgi:heterodisulfide reductase subunit B
MANAIMLVLAGTGHSRKSKPASGDEIARALDRNITSIEARLRSCGVSFVPAQHQSSSMHVTARQLAERAAREAGRDGRDLTAAFCGDPPVGFRALDRRRSVATEARPSASLNLGFTLRSRYR